MTPFGSLPEEAAAAPLPATKAPASRGWETSDLCLFSARVAEAATPPADGSDTSCASLLCAAMLAMVSDGAITLYYSPLYRLARACTCGGAEEMSGRFCRFESAADACRPCQKYHGALHGAVIGPPVTSRAVAECATKENENENESRSGQAQPVHLPR